MRSILVGAVLLAAQGCGGTVAAPPQLEIRSCPAAQVRTYPLDEQGHMQSLLLQRLAIISRGEGPYAVRSLHFELMNAGKVIDERTLGEDEVRSLATLGPRIQSTLKIVPFEFCGTALIEPGVTIAGPILAKDQALVIMRQVFAYDGTRDRLRVRVDGTSHGRPTTATVTLPIRSDFAKTTFSFPLHGTLYVGNGPSFHGTHRSTPSEEFALDIAKLGGDGSVHRGDGAQFEDYYAYGLEVFAAADGRVVRVVDDRAEDPAALQRAGESDSDYMKRFQGYTLRLLKDGPQALPGNYVVIDHGQGEFSLYAHLQQGSVRAHVGDQVKSGTVLGKLGSSGNSTDPHLHFQVCDGPDPLLCAGIPVRFNDVSMLWEFENRALQSGDIVTTH